MSKNKNKKQFKNVKAHFFNVNDNSLRVEQVLDVFADQIETDTGVYHIEDGRKYYDDLSGEIIYVYQVDLPSIVEASKLKSLRRSNALHRIFDYDVRAKPDMFKFIPYVIIAMLIVFK